MKFLRKILSLILVTTITTSALFATPLAVEASTETSIDTSSLVLMESTQDTVLRSEPSKNGAVVADLPVDTLVYVTGFKTNTHDNLWFEVQYFDQTLYCFSERLTEHEHEFTIENSTNPNYYFCECGAFEDRSTTRRTVTGVDDAVIVSGIIFFLVASAVGLMQKNAAASGYAPDDFFNTVGSYGVRYIEDQALLTFIRINAAGAVISVSVNEFQKYMKEHQKENDDDSGEKKYFPATLIAQNNGNDSLLIPDFTKAMSLEEACDFIDQTVSMSGAFGNLRQFMETQIQCCNVYTWTQADAEQLCRQVVQCNRNPINWYGSSKYPDGVNRPDRNANWSVVGSYMHYHLHNAFSETESHRACPHILYGDMITERFDHQDAA